VPAALNLGVGLLVTALAQLHVRNLAQKNRHAPNDKIFPMAVPDRPSCSRGESCIHATFTIAQKLKFSLRAISTEFLLGGNFCSKLRAPHRGRSLGPFVCGANHQLRLHEGKVPLAAMYLRRVGDLAVAWLLAACFLRSRSGCR
jgi:hypothetical protein